MRRRLRWAGGLGMLLAAVHLASAQQATANPAEELIRLEQARQALEKTMDRFRSGGFSSRLELQDAMIDGAFELNSFGPAMVPALIDELEQAKRGNFYFIAYALGLFDRPESREALRGAIARADSENGDFALFRKRWAAFALGLSGDAEAIKLVNSGRHLVGHSSAHANMSTIGAIALQTTPECVPVLLSELERLTENDEQRHQRHSLVRTLGRVGDERAVPGLLGVLAEEPPNQRLRFRAVLALARIGSPQAVEGVLAALEDDDAYIRMAAAVELDSLPPSGVLPRLLRRLEEEEDAGVRGKLYRSIATLGGSPTLETLAGFQDRPDVHERLDLIRAVASLRDPQALPILGAALNDPVNDNAMEAIRGLAQIDTRATTEMLIGQVDSPAWPRAATALTELTRTPRTEAAEAAARRLFEVELKAVVLSPDHRNRVDDLLRAIVAFGHHEVLGKLREAAERQSDGTLLQTLAAAITELELLKNNGDNLKRWIATLDAANPEHRRLAYRRLGQLGNLGAARALVARFGRVELDEGIAILLALGDLDQPPSRELIRRVLLSPEFDLFERHALRDAAAWSARKLGGSEMFESLKESALRRAGRDTRVLIYAAILGREAALPLLADLRVLRMRYLRWLRGNELDKLDWIARRISLGGDLHDYDLPPHQLDFR